MKISNKNYLFAVAVAFTLIKYSQNTLLSLPKKLEKYKVTDEQRLIDFAVVLTT